MKRRKRRRNVTDKAYREWVLRQPCLVTGSRPVQGHHVRINVGMGLKPPDRMMVPVCRPIHHEVQGKDRFWWEERGIDIHAKIAALHQRFEMETGKRVL